MNTVVWFNIGFLSITPYGLLIAIGLYAMYVLTRKIRKYFRPLKGFDTLDCLLTAIPVALICSRFLHWVFSFGEYSLWQALALWRGGYSMFGAWLGFIGGIALYAHRRRLYTMELLDRFAPAMVLFTAIERLAEAFTDQGYGKMVDTSWLQGGPFVLTDMYGSARHAVYRLEFVTAAIALVLLFVFFKRSELKKFRAGGDCFRISLVMIFAPQIVWESMRDDGYLAYGFVRIQQVFSLMAVLYVFAFYMLKVYRQGIRTKELIITLGCVVIGTALAIKQEFAVDTDQNLELNYVIMCIAVAAIVYGVCRTRKIWIARLRQKRRNALRRQAQV